MRNFLYRFSSAIARFMYGRNGSDQLNIALLWLYLALTAVLNILSVLVALVVLFRLFSRNLTRRRAENARFLSWWHPIRCRIAGARQRSLDREHKYFTCKNCRTICRVPAGKGKLEITCPKCGEKIIGKS